MNDVNFNHTKIFWRALQFLAFIIPISQWLSIKFLIALLAYAIYIIIATRNYPAIFKQGWDAGLYFTILLIGLTYTTDLSRGFRVIESSLSLLAVPIIFSAAGNFSRRNYENLLMALTAGVVVASLICLAHSAWIFNQTGATESFVYFHLTSVINIQPTYFGYYLIFALTFLVYSLYYGRLKIRPYLVTMLIGLLFSTLLLTGGLTSVISLVFIFSFFVLKFLQENKTRTKTATIFLVLLMIGAMFAVFSQRDDKDRRITNDYWERSVLWEAALNATPNLFTGVGTGDYRLVLNQYFKDHELPTYADLNLNSHNEFTQVLFSNGVIGLLALTILIGRPLFLSVSHRNILGILTFFPFLIYGITEVFLARYQGVIFFMFLHQVFIAFYVSLRSPFSFKNP